MMYGMCITFPRACTVKQKRGSETQNLTTAEITCFSHAPNFSNTERNVNSLLDNTYCHIQVTFTAHNHFNLSYPYLLLGMKGMIKANFIQLPTSMMDWSYGMAFRMKMCSEDGNIIVNLGSMLLSDTL